MVHVWTNNGIPGRVSGGAVLRPRVRASMAGARGRSLSVDRET